jgi:hypothetical protein
MNLSRRLWIPRLRVPQPSVSILASVSNASGFEYPRLREPQPSGKKQ